MSSPHALRPFGRGNPLSGAILSENVAKSVVEHAGRRLHCEESGERRAESARCSDRVSLKLLLERQARRIRRAVAAHDHKQMLHDVPSLAARRRPPIELWILAPVCTLSIILAQLRNRKDSA
jgi:hypothetical protein